jgi:AraC-like DNA-binding protein
MSTHPWMTWWNLGMPLVQSAQMADPGDPFSGSMTESSDRRAARGSDQHTKRHSPRFSPTRQLPKAMETLPHCIRPAAPGRITPSLLRRLLRAKDRMDAHPQEAWPVQRLAQVSRVSAAHFARSFKDAFGIPPHRYLLSRRLERATALLRETDLSVTEIAFMTGWQSVGTFGRTFRDVTGRSPSGSRQHERAIADDLARIPTCYASASRRPHLDAAVSEKRHRQAKGKMTAQPEEVS